MTALATRDFEVVTEVQVPLAVPLLSHPGWLQRMPWLLQGTTWRGPDGDFDLGLFGSNPVGPTLERWRLLRTALGFVGAIHSRQVHGTRVRLHETAPIGLLLTEGDDGHATARPDLLMTVSAADCIPVSIVDPHHRTCAMLHAGWRGVAAGMVEAGIALLETLGSRAATLRVHFGPAICGKCYEVGPEVHEALGLGVPDHPAPVDIRRAAALRAARCGVPSPEITISTLCTRCEPDLLFSHRAGAPGRQMGVLGIRADRQDGVEGARGAM